MLKVIQTFDPPGVGARDLRECLMLQLERAGQKESLEYRIVRDFMDALGKRRIPEIARGTGCDVEEVQDALATHRAGWNRARAALSAGRRTICRCPKFLCKKSATISSVTTNDEQIPAFAHQQRLQGSDGAGRKFNAEVKNYIREKIRAGKFLIKSLHQRQQTISNIAREIVKRQREFMEKGVAHF